MSEAEAREALVRVLAARAAKLEDAETIRLGVAGLIQLGQHFQEKVIPAIQVVGNLFINVIERTIESFAQFGRLYAFNVVMARHHRRAAQLQVLALPEPMNERDI